MLEVHGCQKSDGHGAINIQDYPEAEVEKWIRRFARGEVTEAPSFDNILDLTRGSSTNQ